MILSMSKPFLKSTYLEWVTPAEFWGNLEMSKITILARTSSTFVTMTTWLIDQISSVKMDLKRVNILSSTVWNWISFPIRGVCMSWINDEFQDDDDYLWFEVNTPQKLHVRNVPWKSILSNSIIFVLWSIDSIS